MAELGERYGVMTSWADRARSQVALADLDVVEAQSDLDQREALFYIENGASTKDKWRYEQQLRADKQWSQRLQALMRRKAYKDLLASVATGHEEKAKALSRELTRRLGAQEKGHQDAYA